MSKSAIPISCCALIASGFLQLVHAVPEVAAKEEPTGKIEGTANADPVPVVDPDKALLATIQFPDGMVGTVFAREPNVQNPTAISIDEQNRIYIAETHRFGRGIEDNRRNTHWLRDEIALRTTAERLAMYEKHAAVKPMEYYTEYSEKIRRIEDRDEDGKADHGQIFAEGFNDPLDGTAAGIMAANGKVYFACIPHVWMLEDTNDDGVADERVSLQEGYGISVSLSGHDLNGFAFGPDGRIYFTIGDRGYDLKTREGRHLYDQYAGAIFRMEPDGSELEVVHSGLRNPKEIAFDQFGAAFSVDNNADMGDLARVVYMVEGADSGWNRGNQNLRNFRNAIDTNRRHQIPWMTESGWNFTGVNRPDAYLPPSAHISNGPSGLAYNPGIGLNPKWDNHFFVCDFKGGNSRVIAFEMEPAGGGYSLVQEADFIKGFLNTDVEFGYDGKMYVSDYTGSWTTYTLGAIFAFHDPEEIKKAVVAQTRKLFAEGFEGRSARELAGLLHHTDMRVRMRAQFTLATDVANRPIFLDATASGNPLVTRLHGVWGLGQLARLQKDSTAAEHLVALSRDANWRVRGQSVQALGEASASSCRGALTARLEDEHQNNQLLAAIALGKVGNVDDIPALIALLERNDDSDPNVRHGAIQGLQSIVEASGSADGVMTFKDHSSAAVRRGLVILLRRIKEPRIAHFLKDKEDSIVIETIQAINDAYIEGARPALADLTEWLGKSTPMIDYRIINAIYRVGGDDRLRQLLKLAEDESKSEAVRLECLFASRRWENPPPADPTTGKHRPISGERDTNAVVPEIIATLKVLLQQSSGQLLADVISTSAAFEIEIAPATLLGHFANGKNTTSIRLTALRSLLAKKDPLLLDVLGKTLDDRDREVRVRSFDALITLAPDEAVSHAREILGSERVYDRQEVLAALAGMDHADAGAIILSRLKDLENQAAAIQLDILEAAAQRNEPEIASALATYNAGIDSTDPVNAFRVALEGGDVDRGRSVFYNHGSAQCTRCHKGQAGRKGGVAGPDLGGVGSQHDRAYLLESLVSPGAKIAPGYATVSLTMKDGSIVVGTLIKKDDEMISIAALSADPTLDPAKGEIHEYALNQVRESSIPMSTMPPMGHLLKKKELRDLIAYLSSLQAQKQ